MHIFQRSLLLFASLAPVLALPLHAQELATISSSAEATSAALPDAPQAQTQTQAQEEANESFLTTIARKIVPARNYPPVAAKWNATINPGQQVSKFTALDKLQFSLREEINPLALFDGALSAGYDQLTDGDPKYGSDSGAFGERFGAAMLRQTTNRIMGDGVYAAAFRQDPRYYRIAKGSILHRGLGSVRQTFVRRTGSDGHPGFNYSGILGIASSSVTTLGYYPEKSANGSVVARSFGTSIATNAGAKLLLEFVPDVIRIIRHE